MATALPLYMETTQTNGDWSDYTMQPTELPTLYAMATDVLYALDDAHARGDWSLAHRLETAHDVAVERAREIAFGGL